MSITKEEIVKNAKRFFEAANAGGFMNEELTSFLGEKFITAPASTMLSLHNAFEGGLIAHSLLVAEYAVKFNKALPQDERMDINSILKICFLHQIGKTFLYKPCESQWHREKQGKMYEFNEELTSMRVGERSINYITRFGIELTEDEYVAILNFDKTEDKMAEYHNSDLGDLLKIANIYAIKNEKRLLNEQE